MMNIVWNKEMKKLTAVFAFVFLMAFLAVNLCVGVYCNRLRTEYNELLAAVFGNVAAVYPEVTEDEMVQVLRESGNEELGASILAKYGVLGTYGSETFAAQERNLLLLRLCSNMVLLLLFLLCGLLLYSYLWKRQQRIYGLTYYMERLNRHEYKLDIEDNGDDELSGLRNEIYKLVVLLREQADMAVEQKHALADSVADISHQLKTPLTSVTVLMDNLAENPDMDQAVRQRFMSEITRQVTGMSWLVATMLKLSRLDAGVVELQRIRLDVGSLVEEALRRLEIAAEWKQLSFSVNVPKDIGLYVDKSWTEEALLNIVKNAIEHSPEGSRIEIQGEENDVYIRIVVRDHGEGITEEEQRKLFCRFYNGSAAKGDSVGIGLALAKEIVEKQGGYISVDSRRGEGTSFILKFLKQR